jgi:Flp pilus assembly protein TadG
MIDHRREEGAVAIMVALMLVVFMAAVALTVDVGGLYLRRRALVNGSDAAALSAARTCARGVGNDPRFTSPEAAADFDVQANSPITIDEVAPTNLTFPPPGGCSVPTQYGHVTVQYTSEQALYFAPVMGFHHESPVTTTATASWGLGSNNPIPLAFGGKLLSSCPVPPNGEPTTSPPQVCATWYDNDDLNDGNFGFLTLDPNGWNVDPSYQGCSNPGTNQLTDWIDGTDPASVVLNWTLPTYVCSSAGFHTGGSSQQGFDALRQLKGQVRDFPIIWEGWGIPSGSSTAQGSIYQSNRIDKYDVIGFAALKIIDVLRRNDVAGTPEQNGTCVTKNNNPVSWTSVGQTLQLDSISSASSSWQDCPPTTPADAITNVVVTKAKNPDPPCCTLGVDYTYDAGTRTITWIGATPKDTQVSFDWKINAQPGRCGTVPNDNSAMCVITEWHGSTLTGDYDQNKDNITVVRLCDLAYAGSCLDQRPR